MDNMDHEKPHKLIVFGAYANYHRNFRVVYLARCALSPRPGSAADAQRHEKPGRFILVRIFLTMCDEPRLDFWVYDTETRTYIWWKSQQLIREYMSDLSITFDHAIVECGRDGAYVKSLVAAGIWYNYERMVLRGCKTWNVAKDCSSLITFNSEKGDPTDRLWEADASQASLSVSKFMSSVRINIRDILVKL
jgi:hypothetical protein